MYLLSAKLEETFKLDTVPVDIVAFEMMELVKNDDVPVNVDIVAFEMMELVKNDDVPVNVDIVAFEMMELVKNDDVPVNVVALINGELMSVVANKLRNEPVDPVAIKDIEGGTGVDAWKL